MTELNKYESNHSDELVKSKTQVKQELKDITKLGKQLAELSIVKLKELPLTEEIIDSYEKLSTIKGNEGRKRHFKYIGKQLRSIPLEPVQLAYARYQKGQALVEPTVNSQVNDTNSLIDRLLADPNATEELLEKHPAFGRQQLRQHIRNAKKSEKHRSKLIHFLNQTLD